MAVADGVDAFVAAEAADVDPAAPIHRRVVSAAEVNFIVIVVVGRCLIVVFCRFVELCD